MKANVSSLMAATEGGDRSAAEVLFVALYRELHRIARRELARRGGASSLGATTVVHEAYLDISGRDVPSFDDEARFMGYAARVMRGVIIDYGRNRHADKRGGQYEITSLRTEIVQRAMSDKDLVALGDALDELAESDASLAEIVDLKFFCGFSFAEIAAMQRTCERTVQRKWEKARLYLHHSLRPSIPPRHDSGSTTIPGSS